MEGPPPLPAVQAGMLEDTLSLVYARTGSLERARSAAREAVRELSMASKPLPALVDAAGTLGMVERNPGNPGGAREAFEISLDTLVRAVGAQDPRTSPARIELANSALDGHPAELQRRLTSAFIEGGN